MTYLIFGSNGYVASNLIDHLKNKKKDFIKLSIKDNYPENNLNIYLKNIFKEFIYNGEKSCDLLINKFVEKFHQEYPNNLIKIAVIPTGYCHKLRPNKLKLIKINFHLPYFYSLISSKLKVKKLVYISSAGIFSNNIQPIENNYLINPQNAYLITKYLTELRIENYFLKNDKCKTKLFILRPTIIYGNSTKGSFLMLEKMIKYGIPIPLTKNKVSKSLLNIDNLIKFIEKIYKYDESNLEVVNKFLLTDDEIVTLEQIIIWISRKYNVKPRIIKLNKFWIFCLKMIYPIYSIFNKLNSSLVYKKSKSNLEFQVKMHSKILKDLKEI